MAEALQIIGDISKVDLQPGDVVVVKLARALTQAAGDKLAELVQPYFPDHQVLVLSDGIDLEVVRRVTSPGD